MDILRFIISHNTILAGILALGLAIWVYADDRRRDQNVSFSALLTTVAFWFFSYVLWYAADEPWQSAFWLRTLLFISSLIPVFFFLFSTTLLTEALPSKKIQILTLAPNAAIAWLVYFTHEVVSLQKDGSLVFGVGRDILSYHFAIFFLFTLGILLYTSRKSVTANKARLTAAVIGAVILFNSIFAILVSTSPQRGSETFWAATIALLAGMIITATSTVRKQHLLDMRLVSIELFILLSISIIVTDIVVSEDILDFTFRLVLLIILVFYGVLTMRSLVTEVRRMREVEALNEHMTKMTGQLIEADQLKTRFVSFASHQMRAPIGGIRSYLYMLLEGDFGEMPKKQQDIIRINIGALENLQQTIDMFLNIAKIEMGGFEYYMQPTPLGPMIGKVVDQMRPLAEKKGLQLRIKLSPTLPAVELDSGKMFHVLVNLLDNAIKYSDQGQITVKAKAVGSEVEVLVVDTGRGFDAAERGRIMAIIKHGLSELKFNESGGSGLGLYIVDKIVEGHSGRFIAESDGAGKGSAIGFRIPIRRERAPDKAF
jgi:signal transduction histidine kinase